MTTLVSFKSKTETSIVTILCLKNNRKPTIRSLNTTVKYTLFAVHNDDSLNILKKEIVTKHHIESPAPVKLVIKSITSEGQYITLYPDHNPATLIPRVRGTIWYSLLFP